MNCPERGWGRASSRTWLLELSVAYTNDSQPRYNAKQELPHGAVHFAFVRCSSVPDKSGAKISSGRIVISFSIQRFSLFLTKLLDCRRI